jgi:hypothetical protein
MRLRHDAMATTNSSRCRYVYQSGFSFSLQGCNAKMTRTWHARTLPCHLRQSQKRNLTTEQNDRERQSNNSFTRSRIRWAQQRHVGRRSCSYEFLYRIMMHIQPTRCVFCLSTRFGIILSLIQKVGECCFRAARLVAMRPTLPGES